MVKDSDDEGLEGEGAEGWGGLLGLGGEAGGWVKFIYGIGCRGFHMKGEFVILLTGRERRRVELWKISAYTIFVFRARMD